MELFRCLSSNKFLVDNLSEMYETHKRAEIPEPPGFGEHCLTNFVVSTPICMSQCRFGGLSIVEHLKFSRSVTFNHRSLLSFHYSPSETYYSHRQPWLLLSVNQSATSVAAAERSVAFHARHAAWDANACGMWCQVRSFRTCSSHLP